MCAAYQVGSMNMVQEKVNLSQTENMSRFIYELNLVDEEGYNRENLII